MQFYSLHEYLNSCQCHILNTSFTYIHVSLQVIHKYSREYLSIRDVNVYSSERPIENEP